MKMMYSLLSLWRGYHSALSSALSVPTSALSVGMLSASHSAEALHHPLHTPCCSPSRTELHHSLRMASIARCLLLALLLAHGLVVSIWPHIVKYMGLCDHQFSCRSRDKSQMSSFDRGHAVIVSARYESLRPDRVLTIGSGISSVGSDAWQAPTSARIMISVPQMS